MIGDSKLNNCKVLGLMWNNVNDTMSFSPKLIPNTTPVTKRIVLSEISKIFDPLGILVPVTVRARIYMQKLWKQNCQWDEILNNQLTADWNLLVGDLNACQTMEFDRSLDVNNHMQLCVFCDIIKYEMVAST